MSPKSFKFKTDNFIQCANILTTKNGETKLSDFGVSKQLNVLDKDTKAVGT